MDKLTFAMENYLEVIYNLSLDGKGARITDIANSLGVTKASTNSAMTALADKGLIVYEKYKEITLTAEGLKQAEFTSKKHEIIYKFFSEVLKIDSTIADIDACSIEHVISNESVHAMHYFMFSRKNEKVDK